jgi:hypothetical protein
MNDETETNVKSLFRVVEGNTPPVEATERTTTYAIMTTDNVEYVREGFLIFTAQHVAVMRELSDNNSIPILVLPLNQVKVVDLIEDDESMDDLFDEDEDTRI